jgi:hypothetical protein
MIVDHLESMFSFMTDEKERKGQQDAHEFLRLLLDAIENSMRSKGITGGNPAEYASIIKRVFGGSLTNTTHCACGCKNTVQELMLDLSLSIDASSIDSVEKALACHSTEEALEGYTCEGCRVTGKATRALEVHTAPEICIIQLKRFGPVATDATNAKNDKFIRFKEELTLRCKGPEGPTDYRLKGIVVHRGNTINRGHFFSYVRNTEGKWHRLDDSNVVHVSINEVLRQKAYILFYAKTSLRDSWNLPPQKTIKPVIFRRGQEVQRSALEGMAKPRSGGATHKKFHTPQRPKRLVSTMTPAKASGKRIAGPVGGALLNALIQTQARNEGNTRVTGSVENDDDEEISSGPDGEPGDLDPDNAPDKAPSSEYIAS